MGGVALSPPQDAPALGLAPFRTATPAAIETRVPRVRVAVRSGKLKRDSLHTNVRRGSVASSLSRPAPSPNPATRGVFDSVTEHSEARARAHARPAFTLGFEHPHIHSKP